MPHKQCRENTHSRDQRAGGNTRKTPLWEWRWQTEDTDYGLHWRKTYIKRGTLLLSCSLIRKWKKITFNHDVISLIFNSTRRCAFFASQTQWGCCFSKRRPIPIILFEPKQWNPNWAQAGISVIKTLYFVPRGPAPVMMPWFLFCVANPQTFQVCNTFASFLFECSTNTAMELFGGDKKPIVFVMFFDYHVQLIPRWL